jgi:hypothetical protein
VFSRLAVQAPSVGLLHTFDRPGGPLGRVRVGGEKLGGRPRRRGAAAAGGRGAAPVRQRDLRDGGEGKSVSEAIRDRAPAKTRDTTRIFKVIPAYVGGSSDHQRRL